MNASVPTDLLLGESVGRNRSDLGVRAEALGYDGLWLTELRAENSVIRLSEIAVQTDEIELGTGIVNVFSRTPAQLAATAATLDDVAGSRFRLGLGTSTQSVVEDLHGVEWNDPNPVRRAHETIDLVKAFSKSEDVVEYEGKIFDVHAGLPVERSVPIYYAALGKVNRRVVARLCDGWLPHMIPIPDLESGYAYIESWMDRIDRDAEIDVAPIVPAAVNDDIEAARNAIRRHVAYCVGSGPGYRRAIARRFPEQTESITTAWRNGNRKTAAELVTTEMVDAIGIVGDSEVAREQLQEVADIDCVSRCVVAPPPAADDRTVEHTIETFAPSVQ